MSGPLQVKLYFPYAGSAVRGNNKPLGCSREDFCFALVVLTIILGLWGMGDGETGMSGSLSTDFCFSLMGSKFFILPSYGNTLIVEFIWISISWEPFKIYIFKLSCSSFWLRYGKKIFGQVFFSGIIYIKENLPFLLSYSCVLTDIQSCTHHHRQDIEPSHPPQSSLLPLCSEPLWPFVVRCGNWAVFCLYTVAFSRSHKNRILM